jgi:hypothetical protein
MIDRHVDVDRLKPRREPMRSPLMRYQTNNMRADPVATKAKREQLRPGQGCYALITLV